MKILQPERCRARVRYSKMNRVGHNRVIQKYTDYTDSTKYQVHRACRELHRTSRRKVII